MIHRPRVATVLSASDWERNFAMMANASSLVRLVARLEACPADTAVSDMDVIVVGAETPWLTGEIMHQWSRRGVHVLGVHRPGDTPAMRLLEQGGADEIWSSATDTEHLVHTARLLGTRPNAPAKPHHRAFYVTGPDGSPGRTEVALALATALTTHGTTYLLDADVRNPAVSMRMGLHPRPNLCDGVPSVFGNLSTIAQPAGPLRVVAGALGCCPPTPASVHAAYDAARTEADYVVADSHAWTSTSRIPAHATPCSYAKRLRRERFELQ